MHNIELLLPGPAGEPAEDDEDQHDKRLDDQLRQSAAAFEATLKWCWLFVTSSVASAGRYFFLACIWLLKVKDTR